MMKKILSFVLLMVVAKFTWAQRITIDQYIAAYKDIAISEMKRTGIPASITLAQGILEAEAGNSYLVRISNNHFGIKCKSNWTGETAYHDDDEKQECFRKYASAHESYVDHSDFLKNSTRYAALFTLAPNDYEGWAHGLKRAGYATNPRYAYLLIGNIEKYNLHQFDQGNENFPPAEMAVVKQEKIIDQGTEKEVSIKIEKTPESDLPKTGDGLTKFNGIKAIYAKKGSSLFAIAANNRISLAKLLEYNDLGDDGLLAEDQILYLDKKKKEGREKTYTLHTNETLRTVSQNLGIQLDALANFNRLGTDDTLSPGTTIYLKPKG